LFSYLWFPFYGVTGTGEFVVKVAVEEALLWTIKPEEISVLAEAAAPDPASFQPAPKPVL